MAGRGRPKGGTAAKKAAEKEKAKKFKELQDKIFNFCHIHNLHCIVAEMLHQAFINNEEHPTKVRTKLLIASTCLIFIICFYRHQYMADYLLKHNNLDPTQYSNGMIAAMNNQLEALQYQRLKDLEEIDNLKRIVRAFRKRIATSPEHSEAENPPMVSIPTVKLARISECMKISMSTHTRSNQVLIPIINTAQSQVNSVKNEVFSPVPVEVDDVFAQERSQDLSSSSPLSSIKQLQSGVEQESLAVKRASVSQAHTAELTPKPNVSVSEIAETTTNIEIESSDSSDSSSSSSSDSSDSSENSQTPSKETKKLIVNKPAGTDNSSESMEIDEMNDVVPSETEKSVNERDEKVSELTKLVEPETPVFTEAAIGEAFEPQTEKLAVPLKNLAEISVTAPPHDEISSAFCQPSENTECIEEDKPHEIIKSPSKELSLDENVNKVSSSEAEDDAKSQPSSVHVDEVAIIQPALTAVEEPFESEIPERVLPPTANDEVESIQPTPTADHQSEAENVEEILPPAVHEEVTITSPTQTAELLPLLLENSEKVLPPVVVEEDESNQPTPTAAVLLTELVKEIAYEVSDTESENLVIDVDAQNSDVSDSENVKLEIDEENVSSLDAEIEMAVEMAEKSIADGSSLSNVFDSSEFDEIFQTPVKPPPAREIPNPSTPTVDDIEMQLMLMETSPNKELAQAEPQLITTSEPEAKEEEPEKTANETETQPEDSEAEPDEKTLEVISPGQETQLGEKEVESEKQLPISPSGQAVSEKVSPTASELELENEFIPDYEED